MIDERQQFHGPNGTLAQGRIVENAIGQWLIQSQGWTLLPPYEIEVPSNKGPRLFTPNGELIVPDLLGMRYKGKKFIFKWWEAKGKSRFTWHRNSGNWQTGIDLRHYEDYIKVQEQTFEVYVLFLHRYSTPSKSDRDNGSPPTCPTGLFGNTLQYLMSHWHHKDKFFNGRRDCPMVYWNESDLERLATLEEVRTLPVSLWKETVSLEDHPF